IASEVSGFVAPFADPGLAELWVHLRPGSAVADVVRVVREEILRLGKEGPSERELLSATSRAELHFYSDLETAAGCAEQIGFATTVTKDPAFGFRRAEITRRSTAADLARSARGHL